MARALGRSLASRTWMSGKSSIGQPIGSPAGASASTSRHTSSRGMGASRPQRTGHRRTQTNTDKHRIDELDPVSWTSFEGRIRCPEWDHARPFVIGTGGKLYLAAIL